MKELKIDQFYSYRFLSELNYSPDGTKAACVVSKCEPEGNRYSSDIYLYEGAGWKQLTVGGNERGYLWEDDTHILFPAVRSEEEKKRAAAMEQFTVYYRIGTEGGEAIPAFELPFRAQEIRKMKDGRWIALGMIDAEYPDYYKMSKEEKAKTGKAYADNADYQVLTEIPFYMNGVGYKDKKRSGLFICDPEKGAFERITPPLCNVLTYTLQDDCVYFIGSDYEDIFSMRSQSVFCYNIGSGELIRFDMKGWALGGLSLLGGKIIVTASYFGDNKYCVGPEGNFYEVNTETGELTLFAENDTSIGNCTGSDCRYGRTHSLREKNGSLYFINNIRNADCLSRLDSDGTVTVVTDKEGSADDFDVNGNGDIIVIGMYDNKLQEVYTLSEDNPLKQVSAFNEDALEGVYVASYNKLTVHSRGWDIDGWVLYPKDFDETKTYPAILDIHGGPKTAYGEIFYHEMQYWANHGYFVFFCNPFGSSGRGAEFAEICGKYGDTDFDNIMDFTDAVLAAYPQIDPSRVGCTGGSYGGFMSNWILGHTDRFAAVATQRSISNWISLSGVSDIGFEFVKAQLGTDIYQPDGPEKMWSMSPLSYINDMNTPTLIIHSFEDYRCPMEQGLQLFTALKEKGVPVRMCTFKGENHELSRSGKPLHRVRRLKEITDWMDQYTAV